MGETVRKGQCPMVLSPWAARPELERSCRAEGTDGRTPWT